MDQTIAAFDMEGEHADFTLAKAPVLSPGPGEIRFKVAAFGLNQADILLSQGRHYMRSELPIRIGYEGCGTVDAIGEGVTRFRVGDRVTVIPNVDGPYWTAGQYALAQERFATAWPEGWSAIEATSLWMQYLTPYFPFVELFPFERGEWVMITAATGATGLGAVAMAKLLGARVIATTRSEYKVPTLKSLGADVVLSTDREDFREAVMEATGQGGVRLLCDSLCGPYAPLLSETLAPRGIMYVHGALAGDNTLSLPVLNLVFRGAGVYGYSLINELRVPGRLERGRDFILDAIGRKALPTPMVDRAFPMDQVRAAYDHMRSGKQTGKIVVTLE